MIYRQYLWRVALALLVAGEAGCAYFSKEASVESAVSRYGKPETAGRVAVPYFMFDKYKSGVGTKSWQDSAITDRFATGLLKQGYRVVDRAHVRQVLKENNMIPSDLFNEDNVQRIGALLGADTVLLGRLTLVEQADGRILERKLNVRGVRVFDGVVVFSVSAVDTTPYRILTGEELADQALAEMFAPKGPQASDARPSQSGVDVTRSAGASSSSGAARIDTSAKLTNDSGGTSREGIPEESAKAADELKADDGQAFSESSGESVASPTENATQGE